MNSDRHLYLSQLAEACTEHEDGELNDSSARAVGDDNDTEVVLKDRSATVEDSQNELNDLSTEVNEMDISRDSIGVNDTDT